MIKICNNQKNYLFWNIIFLIIYLFLTANQVMAVDLFVQAKQQIKDNAGINSTSYFALTVAGLIGGALSGFMTKNWAAAVGGFVAGMIFLNVGMSIVGLK